MKDPRDELERVIRESTGWVPMNSLKAADAILERFTVEPKPAISDEKLGALMSNAVTTDQALSLRQFGERMRAELDLAGLEIVRKEGE